MSKKLFLALAVLAPTLVHVEPAMALRTSRTYRVNYDGLRTGTWRLRNKVSETAHACRYTVKWSNLPAAQSRTRYCEIEEIKAGDYFDCEEARKSFFDTIISKRRGVACRGFDDFGQETNIKLLVAGEDRSGAINGVVVSASVSDVQNFEVTPL